jgi:hypothetical protein
LVTNGGFESGVDPGVSTQLNVGSLQLFGWDIVEGNVDYIGKRFAPAEGARSIELNGANRGTITQTVHGLRQGQRYRLTFQMAVNPEAPPAKTDCVVCLGGVSNVYTLVKAGTLGKPGWRRQALEFDALGDSAELRLISFNDGWAGALLDDFILTAAEQFSPSLPRSFFDLAADFTPKTNPSGPWRYGWKESLEGPLSLLTFEKTSELETGGLLSTWQLNNADGPSVSQASHSAAATPTHPGAISMAPGRTGAPERYAAARFTVPIRSAGRYRIEARVVDDLAGASNGDSEFHILKNGMEIYGLLLGPRAIGSYTNETILGEHDYVDFVVGRGLGSGHPGSSRIVSARLIHLP